MALSSSSTYWNIIQALFWVRYRTDDPIEQITDHINGAVEGGDPHDGSSLLLRPICHASLGEGEYLLPVMRDLSWAGAKRQLLQKCAAMEIEADGCRNDSEVIEHIPTSAFTSCRGVWRNSDDRFAIIPQGLRNGNAGGAWAEIFFRQDQLRLAFPGVEGPPTPDNTQPCQARRKGKSGRKARVVVALHITEMQRLKRLFPELETYSLARRVINELGSPPGSYAADGGVDYLARKFGEEVEEISFICPKLPDSPD